MNEPRVYKNSPAALIVIIAFSVILMAGLAFGVGFESTELVVPLVLFGLFFLVVMFMSISSKVILSEDEISTQSLFGTKSMRWTEIGRVSGRGYGIKLHNVDEDVTVVPSPRLPGYEEIIEFIGRKRPDLFSPLEYGEMKRGLGSFVGLLILGILFFGIMTLFIFEMDFSFDTLIPFMFFAAFILFFMGVFLFSPQSLTLDGRTLVVKYLLNKKELSVDEIAGVQFGYTQTRNGKQYYIAIHLTNRKNIRVSGLRIGLPVGYLVLKNWYQAQSVHMRQTPFNETASNWSDNSRN
jgi:hypothetical protein